MKKVLKIMKKEISLTEDIPVVVVTYIDVISYVKSTTFTKMYGLIGYRNKCIEN